jgi:hypothetical protein
MAIRLLALDLDGTLLTPHGEITRRNRRAVQAARARGVYVTVVTGRRFRDARPLVLQLGLDDVPLISHNGALTKHVHTLETVSVTLLAREAAREVLRVGRGAGADALVSADPHGAGVMLYDSLSPDNHALAAYLRWSETIHGAEAHEAVRRVPSLDDHLQQDPIHISFSGGCAPMAELRELLEKELGEAVKVYATVYPPRDFTLLDILSPSASKALGLAATAAEIRAAPAEIMAVGDNFNDLSMLEYAGTPVVMANADDELRHRPGFHHTASNRDDGVAQAIDKFILNAEN